MSGNQTWARRLWLKAQRAALIVRTGAVLDRFRRLDVPSLPAYAPSATRTCATGPTVAVILDEFSFACFEPEARLVPLTRAGWRQQLDAERPDFVFLESAWHGNGGEWHRALSHLEEDAGAELRELLAACRERGLKVAFWNKEDPVHYTTFLPLARQASWVFTTDAESVARYREDLGHDRVAPLPFAAQPRIHNPVRDQVAETRPICFAGTWYRRYGDRQKQMQALLAPLVGRGLDIYDRNLLKPLQQRMSYLYPLAYRRAIRGGLSHQQVLTAYRSYKLFLNVNTVVHSRTMMARRVYEILACRTPVLSTPSRAVEAVFGELVPVLADGEDVRARVDGLLGDEAARDRLAHAGYREIMRRHTYRERLHDVARAVGCEQRDAPAGSVAVITVATDPARVNRLIENLRRQTLPGIEAIVTWVPAAESAVRAACAGLQATLVPGGSNDPWACVRQAAPRVTADVVCVMLGDDDHYPEYVYDLVTAFRFTDAEIVGKASFFGPDAAGRAALTVLGPEFRHVERVHWRAMALRRPAVDRLAGAPDQASPAAFFASCRGAGAKVFATDRYNYLADAAKVRGVDARVDDLVV